MRMSYHVTGFSNNAVSRVSTIINRVLMEWKMMINIKNGNWLDTYLSNAWIIIYIILQNNDQYDKITVAQAQ